MPIGVYVFLLSSVMTGKVWLASGIERIRRHISTLPSPALWPCRRLSFSSATIRSTPMWKEAKTGYMYRFLFRFWKFKPTEQAPRSVGFFCHFAEKIPRLEKFSLFLLMVKRKVLKEFFLLELFKQETLSLNFGIFPGETRKQRVTEREWQLFETGEDSRDHIHCVRHLLDAVHRLERE